MKKEERYWKQNKERDIERQIFQRNMNLNAERRNIFKDERITQTDNGKTK